MTQPVGQLTQGTDLIVTVSAAASFGQHTASMRPPTARSGKSTGILATSVMGMSKTSQSTETAKMMISGVMNGTVAREESPSANETVASTNTPLNALG